MPDDPSDPDLPLKDDTRLLGRLLGDVLRAQTGEAAFERVESIRQTAIRFHRAAADEAPGVRDELSALLNDLPIPATLNVVRAFSYFSHLANLAEDVHENRRSRAHALAEAPAQPGSISAALEHLAKAGVSPVALEEWLREALVSPILTAHPTEVQRKSILDSEREIVRLLMWRNRTQFTPDELREFEVGLYRQILGLWQTAMLRLSKLQVRDEIDNGLAYYRYTFLDELPRMYERLSTGIARCFGTVPALPSFLRVGSWIGGDRDGNPFVTAETLEYAVRAQAAVAFEHYLGEVHRLGAELSLSTRLVEPTKELLQLAAAAHDSNVHRQDEPYRQALTGLYARLAATSAALSGRAPFRAPHAAASRTRPRRSSQADLEVIAASLATHGAVLLGDPAAGPAHSRGGRVRLSPRIARPAAERRRARSGAGRPFRARGSHGASTRACPRRHASRSCCANSRRRGRCIRRTSTMTSAPSRNWRSCAPPRTCIVATVRRRCPTT